MASRYSKTLRRSAISDQVYRALRENLERRDRVDRALRQNLKLLHRSHSNFYVLGMTGNVYNVKLSIFPYCSCPDPVTPCKHIFFVLIRVLRVSPYIVGLLQSTLPPSELLRLLNQPTAPNAHADAATCQKFHQLFFNRGRECSSNDEEVEDGSSCPICLDEMKKGENISACGTCRNPIHEQCFMEWKRSKVNGMAVCVFCRAPWKN